MLDSLKDKLLKAAALHLKRYLPRYTDDDASFQYGATDYNYELLDQAFRENTWIFAGVNAIADALSAVPLKVYKRVEKDGDVTAEEVTDPDHPLVKVLRNPSPTMSGKALIRRSAGFHTLDGECIWVARHGPEPKFKITTETPTGIDLIESRFIPDDGIEVGMFGAIKSYTYKSPSAATVVIPSVFITHAKNFNPFSHVRGLPVIHVERQALVLMFHMLRYNKEFFMNDATPSGILAAKGVMDEPARRANIKAWEKAHKGKSHKIAALDEEMVFQAVGESNKDAQFVELYSIAREQLLAALGVPPVMVGLLAELNLANSREQKRIFYQNTIVPIGEDISDAFNNQYVEVWHSGENLFVAFDWSTVEPLQFDRKTGAEIDEIHINSGVLSPNEVREGLNRSPREDDGGDVYRVQPQGRVSIEGAANSGGEAKAGPVRGTFIKATQVPTRADQWRARAFGQEKGIAKLNKAMRKFFKQQLDRILTALQEQSKSVTAPDHLKISNADLAKLFSIAEENKEIIAAAKPVLASIAKQTGEETIRNLVAGVAFNANDPLVVEALAAKIPKIQGVNLEMREALSKILTQAGEENLTVQQTSQRIRSKWADIGTGRSITIARTETIGAQNIATEGAFGQSGVVTGKEWLTSRDSDVRDSHSAIDGEKANLGAVFSNGVDVPGGSGPAAEVVNCRCALLAVLED